MTIGQRITCCAANCLRSLAPTAGSFASPRCQVFLKNYVDRLTFSFTAYLRSEKIHRANCIRWIRENYITFRDLELDLIVQRK